MVQSGRIKAWFSMILVFGLAIACAPESGYGERALHIAPPPKSSASAPLQEPENNPAISNVDGAHTSLNSEMSREEYPVSQITEKAAIIRELHLVPLAGGRTIFLVETDRPVQHHLFDEETHQLTLQLLNTEISIDQSKPLLVTDFESALEAVLPMPADDYQSCILLIKLRKIVPHTITQRGNFLEVRFEAETAARPFSDFVPAVSAGQEEWTEIESESVVQVAWQPMAPLSPYPQASYGRNQVLSHDRQFTGTPISIDFYDMDIRSFFRTLQYISGMNFAIDPDVAGRVTLNFENPVPWDQILSLVLRMNGLDAIYEGNIIRIASLATIRKEAQERQEVFQALQENDKQSIALAPLITEYILINYSNVTSEILPHIQSILTERGKANADVRNNQLIITDTHEVVANAREIIRKIDKITPQVVIEARIVEANENLQRALGVEWQAGTSTSGASEYATHPSARLGGRYGYNMSLNGPAGAGTIGLHFARLVGNPLALNAQIQLSETRGDSRIVSSPRIVTLDNKKASITQGFEYPYTTRNSDGDVTTSFKKIEMKLEVTPHITSDKRVAMKVSIDKDDIYDETADGPALQTKKVETELLVNDGDTIVIGGVLVTRMNDSKNAVPFFSKIPLLGWLFKSTRTTNTKEELLIFLTPRIMQLEPARI